MAPAGPPWRARLTEAETGLLPPSVTVTTGWVAIGAPPVPPTGWIVKPTLAGPLPETRNGALEPVYALPEIVAVST